MGTLRFKYIFLGLCIFSSQVAFSSEGSRDALGLCNQSLRSLVNAAAGASRALGVAYRGDPTAINRTIQTVRGVRALKKLSVAVAEIEGWLAKYKAYPNEMRNLARARSRFLSEDQSQYKGRIQIFEDAIRDGRFPIELKFPKDVEVSFNSEEFITQKSGKTLTSEKLESRAKAEAELKEDRKKLKKIERQIIRRKTLQAEIYFYLKTLLDTLSPELLAATVEGFAAEKSRADLSSLEVRPLKIIADAHDLINDPSGQYSNLKPDIDLLNYVNHVTKEKAWPRILGQRHLVESTSAILSQIGKKLVETKNLHALVTSFLALYAVFTTTYWNGFRHKVIDPIHEVALSPDERREKEYMEKLIELKKLISDVAQDRDDFEWRYYNWAQNLAFKDEAVDIFMEDLKGKRKGIYIDAQRDKDLDPDPEVRELILRQAEEAKKIFWHLLRGYENAFGKIEAVEDKLARRTKMVKLLKEPSISTPSPDSANKK